MNRIVNEDGTVVYLVDGLIVSCGSDDPWITAIEEVISEVEDDGK